MGDWSSIPNEALYIASVSSVRKHARERIIGVTGVSDVKVGIVAGVVRNFIGALGDGTAGTASSGGFGVLFGIFVISGICVVAVPVRGRPTVRVDAYPVGSAYELHRFARFAEFSAGRTVSIVPTRRASTGADQFVWSIWGGLWGSGPIDRLIRQRFFIFWTSMWTVYTMFAVLCSVPVRRFFASDLYAIQERRTHLPVGTTAPLFPRQTNLGRFAAERGFAVLFFGDADPGIIFPKINQRSGRRTLRVEAIPSVCATSYFQAAPPSGSI